jgi:hypothetical protein
VPSLSEWNCSRTRNYDDIAAPQSICREFPAIGCSSRLERFLSHESEEDEVSKVQTVNQFRGLIIPLGNSRTITIYEDMSYTIQISRKWKEILASKARCPSWWELVDAWRLVFKLQALPFQIHSYRYHMQPQVPSSREAFNFDMESILRNPVNGCYGARPAAVFSRPFGTLVTQRALRWRLTSKLGYRMTETYILVWS